MTTRTVPASSISSVADDERAQWLDQVYGVFGHPPVTADPILSEFLKGIFSGGHLIGARGDSGFLSTAAAIPVGLTLPGGCQISASCLTGITVDATVRGRGLLRGMMSKLHQHILEMGAPIAVLNPTQWPLYARFGYGVAAWFDSVDIDVENSLRFAADAPRGDTEVRRIAGTEAKGLARSLFDLKRTVTPGAMTMPPAHWDRFVHEPTYTEIDALLGLAKNDRTVRRCVAVADRGVMSYRLLPAWSQEDTPAFAVQVTDLVAVDIDAEVALWRYLFELDLVSRILVTRIPIDHPLRWWVNDPRRARLSRHDGLWVRPLDTVALLTSRRWTGNGALSLRVNDTENYADGTFLLEVQDGQASCTRTESHSDPDLEMDVATLGALILSGTSARELALAGRVQLRDVRCAQIWDALATPARVPFSAYSL